MNEFKQMCRNLRTAEDRVAPDPVWVRRTRDTLLMQVKNTMPSASRITFGYRVRETIRAARPHRMFAWVSRPVMASMSLVVFALGGSVMSVSAAENAMPGDLLYGLKIATEQARVALTSKTEDKVRLKTEFAGRRVVELTSAVGTDKNAETVSQVAEMLKRDMDTIKQQLGDVAQESSTGTAVEVAKLVDQKSIEVMTALQDTKDQLSPEAVEKITEAQSVAADAGVKAIEVLVDNAKDSTDASSVSDVMQVIKDHTEAVAQVTAASVVPAPVVLGASSSTPVATASTTTPLVATTTLLTVAEDASKDSSATTTPILLPDIAAHVKDATTQAFAVQKAKDQQEVASSTAAENAPATDASATTPEVKPATDTKEAVEKTASP